MAITYATIKTIMVETISYLGVKYPAFQAKGNAAQFAIPYAQHVCKGLGVDVGCNKRQWAFPGSIPIDISFEEEWHALHLPHEGCLDFIFSSHCLEHIPNWVNVMDYWYDCLKDDDDEGGTLFLYLPDYSQEYWRPWHNRKHMHIFTPQTIKDYMKDKGYKNIFASQVDLNCSFMIMGQK